MYAMTPRVLVAVAVALLLLNAATAREDERTLIDLAKEKFGELSDNDKRLFQAIENGVIADYTDQEDKVLSANRIAWLCTDRNASALLTHRGVQIRGAIIIGELQLAFATALSPMTVEDSTFTENIDLIQSRLRGLYLMGTQTRSIFADRMHVDGDVFLRNGFQAKGEVRLSGATISKDLDCSGGHFSNVVGEALSAESIRIGNKALLRNGFRAEGTVNLHSASIGGELDCTGAHLSNPDGNALLADCIEVNGPIFMRNDFQAKGHVRLLSGFVGQGLYCSSARFSNSGGYALTADGIHVAGSILLDDDFRAEGEVRFVGADIGGQLACANALFSNPGAHALSADAVKAKNGVFLRDNCRAEGEVSFVGAIIDGQLSCINSRFSNHDGYALAADTVKVLGDALFGNGFVAEGEVRLLGATIDGRLDCGNGHFSNPSGRAFCAEGITVGRGALFRHDFLAEGEVSLSGAKIGGPLICTNGHFSNPDGVALSAYEMTVKDGVLLNDSFHANGWVDLTGTTILGSLMLTHVYAPSELWLRLDSAHIGVIRDQEKSWPRRPGSLSLDGLVYDRIHQDAPLDAKTRIRWLNRQPQDRFLPQPYEQLASVLRNMGHGEAAKDILIEKAEARARSGQMTPPGRVMHWLWGLFIDYGHRPLKALGWCIGIVLLGAGIFCWAHGADLMLEKKEAFKPRRQDGVEISQYPSFNAFVYSLDTFAPLVDLHQTRYWLPKDSWVRWYFWLHIALGWILTTFLVAGVTGLIRG